MSKIRSLSLALALTTGAASLAAAQTASATAQHQHVAGDSTRWDRGQRGRGEAALFRGITLTADQKAQIKSIHEKYRSQNAGWRDSAKVAGHDRNRQRGDSASRPRLSDADRAKFRAQREQQIAEVRAVLTPDQRTKFDANLAERQSRLGQAGARRAQRKQG
jgi:Spy/CpxP family protein refolding chaperone